MEIARILENKSDSKVYGLMGNINLTSYNYNYSIINDYKFKGTVKGYLNSAKDIKALKIVMLNEEYLLKTANDLTENEIKIVNLAKALIDNKENLILDFFEKGLNYREKENYKRLFKKIAKNYNKKILIFTNDIEFIWDITDEIMIIDIKDVINTVKKRDYFKIIEFIDKPEISRFIELTRAKNIKIEDYKNTMDLLKAIYRIKGD